MRIARYESGVGIVVRYACSRDTVRGVVGSAVGAVLCFMGSSVSAQEPLKLAGTQLEPVRWTELVGWTADDHLAAFAAYERSCQTLLKRRRAEDDGQIHGAIWNVCQKIIGLRRSDSAAARTIFEQNFLPVRIARLGEAEGLLTGYFEPIVQGSRFPNRVFHFPLYRRPPNLVTVGHRLGSVAFPNKGRIGRLNEKHQVVPRTRRTAKATLPSPSADHFFSGDKSLADLPYPDRKAFFADMCTIYREEMADLGRLGCTYLQIHEVPIAVLCDPKNQDRVRERGEDPEQLIDDYIAAINDAVLGRPAGLTVCVHLCRGNAGQRQASGGYDPVAERLLQGTNVDGFFLEYDTERAGDFRPLRFLPKEKVAVLGIISTKLKELEPVDDVKRQHAVNTAAAAILWIGP